MSIEIATPDHVICLGGYQNGRMLSEKLVNLGKGIRMCAVIVDIEYGEPPVWQAQLYDSDIVRVFEGDL